MTTRIEEFNDTVTSAITPVTTNITGATGAPGQAFQVDEFTDFSEAKRAEIEAYGTPNAGHGVVTSTNPYVVVVQVDNRSSAERTGGPAALNDDISRHVIEWNGATATGGGGEWFDYGPFSALDGSVWHTGDGVPADSLGVDNDLYLNVTAGSGRGDVYQKVSGTWGSPIVNLSQTASNAILTDGEGFTGDGQTGTALALELDGTTLTKSASGLRWNTTLESKLAQYPTPLIANDGMYLRVNAAGNFEIVTIANATASADGFMSMVDKQKLDKYTNPASESTGGADDSVDAGRVNKVNGAGNMELLVGDKTFVGLDYIPNQFDNTLGYTMGDFVFFEGVNYRALVTQAMPTPPAVLTNPDDDSTNWLSLGGGHIIVDGTSGSDVALTPQANLRFLGNAQVADNAGNKSTDITITGESPADFNLFADGNLDFALASQYTTTGNGTFAISSANVLRGGKSGNWTAVSNASTVTSPSIPIPLGYRDKIVEFSLIYRSTDQVTLELLNGSTVINSQVLEPFTSTNGSRKIRVFQKLRSDQTAISFRFSSSSVTTFTFDDVIITDNFNSTGQLTNVRRFTSTKEPLSANSPGVGSVATKIMDWNVDVTNTVEGSGGDLLTYARTAANGSSWTVNEDCRLTGFYSSSHSSDFNNGGWSKNAGNSTTDIQDLAANLLISMQDIGFSNSPYSTFLAYDAKAGDVIRCHGNGTDFNSFSEWRLELQAEKIETQDVTVYNAQTSAANSFSARCDGKLTGTATNRIYSQSNSFVSSVVRDSLGVFTVNFVIGTFGQIPSVLASVIDTDTNSDRQIAVVNTSITSCQITIEAPTDNGGRDENFDIIVNRQGGDVRSQTANFTIPAISAGENDFAAIIAERTTNGNNTITSQNGNWLSTVARTAIGNYTVTFTPGFFTQIPAMFGTETGTATTGGGRIVTIDMLTTSSCRVLLYSSATGTSGAFIDDEFTLHAKNQGADYVAPEVIEVPTQAITTTSNSENTFRARLQGDATVAITTQTPRDFITAYARAKAGEYSITLDTSIFTEMPIIQGTCLEGGGDTNVAYVNVQSYNASTGVLIINTLAGLSLISVDEMMLSITRNGVDYVEPMEVTVQTPLIRPNEPFLFQRKDLGTTISGTSTDVADLTFNNLEIGKVYRIGGDSFTNQAAGQDGNLAFFDAASGGGNKLGEVGISANASTGGNFKRSINLLFVASTTVMVSRINVANGATFTTESFITLEELPYYEQTTKWT